jgi:thiol-disulfide isomerase/thioredoxin
VLAPVGAAAGPQAKDAPKAKGQKTDTLLADGLAKARGEGRAVFLAFGAPTCGWCKYLDQYHARPAVAKTLHKHLVFVKVDVVEHPGGTELYQKYTPRQGGVPVWVILSADGKVLGDSFADGKTNVGFPYEPNELVHYERVLRAALPQLSGDELALLMKELKEIGPQKK